jgi:hypothetical protein
VISETFRAAVRRARDPVSLAFWRSPLRRGHCSAILVPLIFLGPRDRHQVLGLTGALSQGDLIVIYLRPVSVWAGHGNVILKRMISLPPWIKTFPYKESPTSTALAALLVEMLHPHRFFGILCADILAIHHCVGPVPPNLTLTRVVGPRLAPVHASDIMKAKPSRRSILAGLATTPHWLCQRSHLAVAIRSLRQSSATKPQCSVRGGVARHERVRGSARRCRGRD